ncbi:hypothetical protein [Streptomyces hygroscopicus]|uniref:hypothetical protein n=1 Tax=Streptomyces hygroscopicus TaxID=1912 RepID=UPI00368C6CAD
MITPQHHAALPSRRTVLRGALLTATTALSAHLAGCSPSSPPPSASPPPSQSAATTGSDANRVLPAYFSRPGENYYYGGRTDLKVGNTQVLAEKIADRIACDTYASRPPTPTRTTTTRPSNATSANRTPTSARPSKAARPPSTATTPSS